MHLAGLCEIKVSGRAPRDRNPEEKPTAGLRGRDVEGGLELGVQDIEKPVGETPKKEEDGDEGDGKDGLPDGQGRGSCKSAVGDGSSVDVDLSIGGFALLMDLLRSGLLAFAKHIDCAVGRDDEVQARVRVKALEAKHADRLACNSEIKG